ncbi:hypothetical protein Hanom_Chr09g00834641 [Helianthus anomalus]
MVLSHVRNSRFNLKRVLQSTFKHITERCKRLGQTTNRSQRVIPSCNLLLRES